MSLRAKTYKRYSDHRQDGGLSIEYQTEACDAFISRKKWLNLGDYVDEAKTAKKVAGREAFNQMLKDAENGLFDVLVVYKFNRSFRNVSEAHKYRRLLKSYGVQLVSATQEVDETTSHGRMNINLIHTFDEYQSDITSEHVTSAMKVIASKALFTGGFVPFGYAVEEVEKGNPKSGKRFIVNEEEAKAIRRIFELYAQGHSLNALVHLMRENGYISRKGAPMGLTTLARILRNDFYIGVYRYTIHGQEIIIPDGVPAIIDQDTWQEVQKRKEANKLLKPRKRKRLYSLTGKIFCKCGAHFFGTHKPGTKKSPYSYSYYMCSVKKNRFGCDCLGIRKDHLEAWIMKVIKKEVLNEERIKFIASEIIKHTGKAPRKSKEDLNALKARKKELLEILGDLVDMKLSKQISQEVLTIKSASYEQELHNVTEKIAIIENSTKTVFTIETVSQYLNDLLASSNEKDQYLQKFIFDALIDRIEIDNESIKLYIKVAPFAPIGDNTPLGHPVYILSTEIKRPDLINLYRAKTWPFAHKL